MIGAKRIDDLSEQVSADRRMGCDELAEGRTELHVNVPDPRFGFFHFAEFRRPRNFARAREDFLCRSRVAQSRVIDEKLQVRKILRRLDQIAWVVVIHHGA